MTVEVALASEVEAADELAEPMRWPDRVCNRRERASAARELATMIAFYARMIYPDVLRTQKSLMNSPSDTAPPRAIRALTHLEARVLGVLVEKQHTVPDTYPLSLNALTAGCNQKTARAPVMNVTEAEVLSAIEDLKHLSLVFEGSSSRVPRFEHNLNRVLGVPNQAAALLTVLLLRGAQTAAELRLNSARLHGFADASSAEAFLDELAERDPPLVVKLPRAPGEREARWMHLLCGEVSVSAPGASVGGNEGALADAGTLADFDALRIEQKRLGDEVARLQALVEHMAAELGISLDKLTGQS